MNARTSQALDSLYQQAASHHGVITRAQAHQAGLTDRQIHQRLATGSWRRVLRGVYYIHPASPPPKVPLPAMLTAARVRYGAGVAASDHTAVMLLGGTAMLADAPTSVSLCVPPTPATVGGPRQPKTKDSGWSVQLHSRVLDPTEICTAKGFRVTTPARTIRDLSPKLGLEAAVCFFDAVLREKWLTVDQLRELIHRGDATFALARQALEHTRVGSGSILETKWRMLLAAHGLAPDVLQYEYRHDGRTFLADMAWLGRLAVLTLECDGAEVHSTPEAVFGDRTRQNAFAGGGIYLLRATWRDLYHPQPILREIRRGLALINGRAAA